MSNSSSSQSPPPESTPLSPAGTASGKDSPPSPASPSSNNSPPSPSSNSSPPSQNSGSPTPPSQSDSPPSPPTPSPPSSDSSNPSPVSDSSPPSPSPSPPSRSEGSTPPPSSNGSRPPASNSSPPPAENDTPVTSPPISPPPPKSQLPSPTTDLFPPPPPPLSPSSDDFSPPVKPKHYRGPPPPSSDDQTPSTNSNSSTPTPDSSGRNNGAIAGLVVAGVIVVLVSVLFVVIRKRRRRWDDLDYQPPTIISVRTDGYRQANPMGGTGYSGPYYSSGPQSGGFGGMEGSTEYGNQSGPFSAPGSQSSFTYEELAEVTNGFSRENIIGEGGFGCVYKGCLPDGRKVAVKQLKAGSGQGEREFRAEVEIISRVHHRHLVSLVGYCIAEYHRLLVYEFLPNDTLEHHLHAKNLPVMDWSKRVRIAIGSAKGLAYLHEDCHPRIIHRDIKSANILLEDLFEPQVADFGLAKLSNDTHTHVSTRVMGTFGYMAPEYASSGKLTDRSDVFSFGVVLLELITGRKPVDTTRPLGDESLVEWARPLLVHALETGNCDELVDPRLDNNYNKTEMLRMIEAAAACVRHSAPKRPRMVQVARSLDIEDSMPDLTNGVKYGQSQAFDSRQYSSDIQKFRLMAFGNNETNTFGDPSGEYDRQSAPYSGEFHGNQQRPQPPKDQQSSGESSGTHDSDTNPMFRGERSNVMGSFRQSGRGFT